MTTTMSSTQSSILKQKIPGGEIPTGKRSPQKEETTQAERVTQTAQRLGKIFAFTMEAGTAEVVKLEILDANGTRRELTEEEKANLAQASAEGGMRELIERAFEAGIACILGDDELQDATDEPGDEAELRHVLLTPLIEQSPVKRLFQREALNRAILGTLIQHATKKAPAPTESSSPSEPQSDRAAPARAN